MGARGSCWRAGAEGWPEWPHLPTQAPSYLATLLLLPLLLLLLLLLLQAQGSTARGE